MKSGRGTRRVGTGWRMTTPGGQPQLDRIADPSLRPAMELLPTELVLRSSCGCPPGTVIRQPVPTLMVPRPELTGAGPARAGARPGRRPARQVAKA